MSEPIAPPAQQDTDTTLAVLFGDSLAFDSQSELLSLYLADAVWRVSVNVFPGTQFNTIAWSNRYPSVPAGCTVVLALGTNDVSAKTLDACKMDARTAIAACTNAGAARVVVPTLNETSAELTGRLTIVQMWNQWLWAAENSAHVDYRALDVVDWAAVSEGHTEWLVADHVHHTAAGQQAYAQFLYDSRLPEGS